MESLFDEYFNRILRDHLKYPETFTLEFTDNRITLNPDQPSNLLNLIKIDPKIKQQLIDLVQSNIKAHNIQEVYISTHGNDIVFNIVYKSPYNIEEIPEIGIYANIVSAMDLKSLNDWCRTNQKFNKYCQNNQFWIALMKERFSGYLTK